MVILFNFYDDGEEYNINSATKAIVHQKTSKGNIIETPCTFINYKGKRVVRFEVEDVAMVEFGYLNLLLTVWNGHEVISIQPFNVLVYDDYMGGASSFIELIQELQRLIESMIVELNDAIKVTEKGQPNGVATLDKDGKIPVIQLPKEFEAFLEHIDHTVFEHQVHGLKLDDDGLLMYLDNNNNWQYVGFSDTGVGGVSQLQAEIEVKDGTAKVTYIGIPTVAQSKWSTGDNTTNHFLLNGTTFTGATFPVSSLGIHTLYYKDSNGIEYVKPFNVTSAMLGKPSVDIEADDGYVIVTIPPSTNVSVKKWAKGNRDVSYFAYNGTVFTSNTFQVTETGAYTIYIKTATNVEYVYVFEVTETMLPAKDVTPPNLTYNIAYGANNATITVTASDTESGVSYITKPDNSKVYSTTTTHSVQNNGTFRFYAHDNAGNSNFIDITVGNVTMSPPSIVLNHSPIGFTNGNVTINAIISSNISGGTITARKWTSGTQSLPYFASSGTTFTGSTFPVSSNGTYTVYAKDSHGAESVKTINISSIDNIPPTINLSSSPTTYTSGNVTIYVSVSESQSGLSSVKWAKGNRAASYFNTSGTSIASGSSFSATANDTYTVYAKDNAGNTVIETVVINNIDKTKPTLTLSQSGSGVTKTITANASDSDSGIYHIRKPDGSYAYSSNTTYSVSANGAYEFTVTDNAGNTLSKSITVSGVSAGSPPAITLESSPTTYGDAVITIDVTGSTNIVSVKYDSGSRTTSYFSSGSGKDLDYHFFKTNVAGIYTVYVRDINGNEAVKTINVTMTTNGTGWSMPMWAGKSSSVDYDISSSILDNNMLGDIDKLVFWWNVDNKPTPLSFFRNGHGIYSSLTNETSYHNYSPFFQYKTILTNSGWSIERRIAVKFTNVPKGCFTTYIKLKNGKEFISYSGIVGAT